MPGLHGVSHLLPFRRSIRQADRSDPSPNRATIRSSFDGEVIPPIDLCRLSLSRPPAIAGVAVVDLSAERDAEVDQANEAFVAVADSVASDGGVVADGKFWWVVSVPVPSPGTPAEG